MVHLAKIQHLRPFFAKVATDKCFIKNIPKLYALKKLFISLKNEREDLIIPFLA